MVTKWGQPSPATWDSAILHLNSRVAEATDTAELITLLEQLITTETRRGYAAESASQLLKIVTLEVKIPLTPSIPERQQHIATIGSRPGPSLQEDRAIAQLRSALTFTHSDGGVRLSGVIADLIAQAAAAPGSSESFQVAAVRLLWGALGATRTATPSDEWGHAAWTISVLIASIAKKKPDSPTTRQLTVAILSAMLDLEEIGFFQKERITSTRNLLSYIV